MNFCSFRIQFLNFASQSHDVSPLDRQRSTNFSTESFMSFSVRLQLNPNSMIAGPSSSSAIGTTVGFCGRGFSGFSLSLTVLLMCSSSLYAFRPVGMVFPSGGKVLSAIWELLSLWWELLFREVHLSGHAR